MSQKQTTKEQLLSKIDDRTLRIAVIGVGYVGLPLAIAFADAGFQITAIDLNPAKVEALNEGRSYVQDVPNQDVKRLVAAGRLRASDSYEEIVDAQAVIICVPTPLRKTKDPDISHIVDAADKIERFGGSGKLIVLESTTYPGTTEEVILPRLVSNGDQVGRDFFLAFSPERIDPGRTDYVMSNTPKVIGGMTAECGEVAVALYACVTEQPVPVSGPATAEMVKLLENTFRAVNIGLVNEVALMCNKLDIDVWEVVQAAATKPYGFMPFYPGPGLGGHCIPIDPHYLGWKLRTLNYTARFIEVASDVNSQMPQYVVGRITEALNEQFKAVNGSKVIILGVAYKPNVGDVRESPALDVIHLLKERGAEVRYHDPFVNDLDAQLVAAERIELSADGLQDADCLVVITNHDEYDWPWIVSQTRLIVDTRNALQGLKHDHIVGL